MRPKSEDAGPSLRSAFVSFCRITWPVLNKAALTRHGFGGAPHRGDLSLDKTSRGFKSGAAFLIPLLVQGEVATVRRPAEAVAGEGSLVQHGTCVLQKFRRL